MSPPVWGGHGFPSAIQLPGFNFQSTRSQDPWLVASCPLHRFRLYIKPSTRLDRPVNQSLAIDYPPRGRSPPTVSARRSVCCPGVTVDRFHRSRRYRLAFPGTGNLTQPMVGWTCHPPTCSHCRLSGRPHGLCGPITARLQAD